jgi:hypothetical protein
MRRLVSRIESELKEQEICAVYNSELARIWPKRISVEKRKEQIRRFAQEHDLDVTFYDVGLCAVFEKPHGDEAPRPKILLPLHRKQSRRRRRPRGG